ncbi:EpsG family protein [Treponema brennaborense]|uniref:EpsG family protein n=1 Tax=Treponema brennaborense (strain DSM 12168 / CIP 105900 / DD5/3) TaxID=906968 RepID=F4LPZ6_TREBD|nr:EpsG family protein [Treponema brennaborense]AEE17074.1 hypothetical protein Trebr_1652 [Treponema brennaborense DSM 12168]
MMYALLFSSFFLPILFEIYVPCKNNGNVLFHSQKELQKVLFYFLFLIFFFVCAFRYKTGYDWIPYELYYQDFPKSLLKDNCEPFFIALYAICKFFGLNFYGMQIFVSLFCCSVIFKCYKKFSPFPALSIFCYACFYYHILQMGFVRQEIAIAFSLLAVMKFADKKKRSAFILTLVGTLFHYSSFLLFVMFFIKVTELNKKKMFFILLLAYILLGNWMVLRFLFLLIAKLPFIPSKIIRMIDIYFSLTNMTSNAGFYGVGWFSRRIVVWIAVFSAHTNSKTEILIYKLTWIGLILECFGLPVIVLGRLSYLFLCFEFIAITLFLRDFFIIKTNSFFKTLIIFLVLLFYSVQGPVNFIFFRTDDEAKRYKPYYSLFNPPSSSLRIQHQLNRYYETHGR